MLSEAPGLRGEVRSRRGEVRSRPVGRPRLNQGSSRGEGRLDFRGREDKDCGCTTGRESQVKVNAGAESSRWP